MVRSAIECGSLPAATGLHGQACLSATGIGGSIRLSTDFLQVRVEFVELLVSGGKGRVALGVINAAPTAQKKAIPTIIARNNALLASGE